MTSLHSPTGTVHFKSADLLEKLANTSVRSLRATLLYALADLEETPDELRPIYNAAAVCEMSPGSREIGDIIPLLRDQGLALTDAFDRVNWSRLACTEDRVVRADAYTTLADRARKRGEEGVAKLLEILADTELLVSRMATTESRVTLTHVRLVIAAVFFLLAAAIVVGGLIQEGDIDGVWAQITGVWAQITGVWAQITDLMS